MIAWLRAEVLHVAWRRGWYSPPDRRMLVRILDALAADPAYGAVLFVGVQWYTAAYAARFPPGRRFATIDPNPAVARFGADGHVVGAVQDVGALFSDVTFDAIVMNGVIGFGLDDPREVERAIGACAAKLRPGGLLVLGVNEQKPTHVDPAPFLEAAGMAPTAFGPADAARVTVPVPFRERSHTFAFWRKAS